MANMTIIADTVANLDVHLHIPADFVSSKVCETARE